MRADELPNPIRHHYSVEQLTRCVRIVRSPTKDRRITIHFPDETHLWLCSNLTGWVCKARHKGEVTC